MNNNKGPSMLRSILGYSFLFLGVVASFIPILQGWVFFVIGLVLLKDVPWALKLRGWIQRRYPETRPFFQKAYKKIESWLAKWRGH